ncbi:MAG: NAD(P)/FAD-dependent oxidoreductase [Acidimicrobiales bacterium]
MGRVNDSLGQIGLPAPISELAGRNWDVVVVGGGHNGLTAAAYLARGGLDVLVLERNLRVGGACTLEQPFPESEYLVSPCAYLVGLLHPLVVEELALHKRGYSVKIVDPHLWCPFEDGSSIALWNDSEKSREAVATLSPKDFDGFAAYENLFARIRKAIRGGERDYWVGDSPDRAQIEELVGHDPELIEILFEESIASVVERHVTDERLRIALHGQGVIGTNAGPRDPGTAAVHMMHSFGTLEGQPGAWGYVIGGMGRVSFALAEAAEEAGAVLACGVSVAAVIPGEGVRLEGGEMLRARAVVSNADPKSTAALLEGDIPAAFTERVAKWRSDSPVLKVNCALSRLPTFTAASPDVEPYKAMVTISNSVDETQSAYEQSRRGEPAPYWCELYFHTAYDSSVAPSGRHAMSIFAQYAPYQLSHGTWDWRREEIGDLVLAHVSRFAPDIAQCVEYREVLGPPDIEAKIGSTGGHIFHGDCLPEQLWTNRFSPRTPVDGVYLCSAATHPGGSVIAVNGRNAAMAVLSDLGVTNP